MRPPVRTQRQSLAESKAAYNHPTYAKMAFAMGCGVQGRGKGCYVFDEADRPFLAMFDQYGNQSFGYAHPRLVQAVRERLETANLNSTKIMFEEVQIRLSERLARLTDGLLPYSYLANGGGESIDNALKLARAATGRPDFVTAVDCFHGKTIATLSASRRPEHEAIYRPLMSEFRQVPFGDVAAVDAAVDERTAAVLLEPIQAEGGVVVPPPGYLREVRRICTERGALLILDEMQTAFGRCGTFFAFQQFDVVPDLICIGKAFGGGLLPISAVLGTPEVWTSLTRTPSTFGSSLGGNPLSCTAGLAAIELASEPAFLAAVGARSEQIQLRLTDLAARFPALIKAHRGLGMMHGLEFFDQALGGLVLWLLIRRQVTSTYSLYNNSVLRVQPPMVISEEELDRGLDVLEGVLATIEEYQNAGGVTGVAAMSPQSHTVELSYPAAAVRALLERRPRLLDPFSLNPEREDVPLAEPEFEGTLGEDLVVWAEMVEQDADRIVLRAGECWMWDLLVRTYTLVRTGDESCRVEITLEWDAGTGGYEGLLAGGISWFAATRVPQLAEGLRAHLAK